MQAAKAPYGLMAGAQIKMISIAENDLSVEIGNQSARKNALDGPLRADGHKHRRLDNPMRGVKKAGARTCNGADRLNLEAQHRFHCRGRLSNDLSCYSYGLRIRGICDRGAHYAARPLYNSVSL